MVSQCQKENRSNNSVSTLRDRPPRPTPLFLWSLFSCLSRVVGWLVRVCVIRERKKRRLSAPFGSQPVSSSGQYMGYCTPCQAPPHVCRSQCCSAVLHQEVRTVPVLSGNGRRPSQHGEPCYWT